MKTLMKWNLEDYHKLVDNGLLVDKNIELLDGELIEVSPESPIHSYLTRTGVQYLREKLKGLAFVMEAHPITLGNSEPEPDIAIVAPHDHNYKNRHPFAEDIFWLIEISNKTLSYDLNEKKQTYAKEGVKEYWVADINNYQVHSFLDPIGNDYSASKILSTGIIRPQSFPKIELVINQLFSW